MMPLLGKFSLKEHVEGSQSSQIGGKWADTVTLPNLFLSLLWDVKQWDSTASLFLSATTSLNSGRCVRPGICGYVRLINTDTSVLCCGYTHQGAVVQQRRGDVVVEAERQDVSLSGAQSHFVFWRFRETRLCVIIVMTWTHRGREQIFTAVCLQKLWLSLRWDH